MSNTNQTVPQLNSKNSDPFVPTLFLWGINTPVCAAYLINKPSFTLGKAETCDGVLGFSEEISREHARITYHDGVYYLSDLGSTNKTYLNGQMLNPDEETHLNIGDRVTLSVYSFNVDHIND